MSIDWDAEERRWRRHAVKSRVLLAVATVLWALVVALMLVRN